MRKIFLIAMAITCCSTIIAQSNGCNNNTPGWGTSLGTVSFVSDRTWTIGNQTWSDAVTTTACQKQTFNGGNRAYVNNQWSYNFYSDCRSNPGFSGNLFSWCAVVRFQDQLCPHPWRVPTVQDFVVLDIALGGTGSLQAVTPRFVIDNYINRWGGVFSGVASESELYDSGTWGHYWSQSGQTGTNYMFGFSLGFSMRTNLNNGFGFLHAQYTRVKYQGRMLRCVR